MFNFGCIRVISLRVDADDVWFVDCCIGVAQSSRCDGQSQVLHPGAQPDAAQQQQQPHQCTGGRGAGLAGAPCPQQYHGGLASAFRSSVIGATAAPAAVPCTSVDDSAAFYFHHDGTASYRTTPVAAAAAAAANYYEKCLI